LVLRRAWEKIAMKIESVAAAVILIFVFVAFYLSLLSLQTVDEVARRNLLISATGSFVIALILFIFLIFYVGVRRAFSEER
jgi:hypothetical protein